MNINVTGTRILGSFAATFLLSALGATPGAAETADVDRTIGNTEAIIPSDSPKAGTKGSLDGIKPKAVTEGSLDGIKPKAGTEGSLDGI